MNPLEIIRELNKDNKYITYFCYEAGKKNKIFILVNSEDFHLIFRVAKDGEYVDVKKTKNDIATLLITASKTIGFEAKVSVGFRDLTTATFRIKKRFDAIELSSRMLGLGFNPDDPFTYCNGIQERSQLKEKVINIDSQFAKHVRGKRIRFSMLIILFSLLIGIIIFAGVYFGLSI
jgi:hypothetical protein